MFRKIVLIGLIGLLVSIMGAGCDKESDSDQEQAEKTEQMMQEMNRQIGMPNITNFQQRKLMKMVYELTDKEKLICYAYLKSDYSGKLIYIGKCVGFGVPFSAQFTNPEKIGYARRGVGALTLPQADPNGLFMPTSSSATWLMMIDPETNKPRPVYLEPEIVVSPFRLDIGARENVK